jgi:hypothetical protein
MAPPFGEGNDAASCLAVESHPMPGLTQDFMCSGHREKRTHHCTLSAE